MHEIWRDLGLRKYGLEHLSTMKHEEAMRWAILFPGKHGMEALMLALKEVEIK